MSRIAKKTAVTPKVYKQFAIVTVIITALPAMFADGENSQAVADAIREKQQQEALRAAEAKKLRESHELARKPVVADNGGGSSSGGGEGPDFAPVSAGPGSSGPPPSPYGYGRPASVIENPLLPPRDGRPRVVAKDAKTPEGQPGNGERQDDRYLGNNSTPSSEQMDKIRAASAARSGNDGSDE